MAKRNCMINGNGARAHILPVTIVMGFAAQNHFPGLLEPFLHLPMVSRTIVVSPENPGVLPEKCEWLEGITPTTGFALNRLLAIVDTPYLLFVQPLADIALGPYCLERFVEVAATTGAGMVYCDFEEMVAEERRPHPVNDYQLGSIREEFDFGPLTLWTVAAIRDSVSKWGRLAWSGDTFFCKVSPDVGWYDLRLKVSLEYALFHIREALYTMTANAATAGHFAYVDPRNYEIQKELEGIATEHLKRLGAFLPPAFSDLPPSQDSFPVEASVVIPVRNREHTIAEAVQSALAQETVFPFNVLVVDNHSTDGTTAVLATLAKQNAGLRHLVPSRLDLNIGGCWNEAVFSPDCGRYAVQLDSDDLYASPHTLAKIVDLLRSGPYAMVIGAYTLVNARLEEIPPGLIAHREWTDDNGRNNALRINGLGAPRAFNTAVLRHFRFLNVGYGEDYAITLRLSRQYQIGRIYENLYWCRRWAGNSDAALTIEQKNRYDAFKDQMRTLEIIARQELNREVKR
jgi:hypothetical protein